MRRKALVLALGAALAVSLAPVASTATHCGDGLLFIFTGRAELDDPLYPGVPTVPFLNGGVAQCSTPDAAHAVNLATFVPGANALRVGAINYCADGTRTQACPPPSGSITFSGAGSVTLAWTWQAANQTGTVNRWISQRVLIPAAATGATASASLRDSDRVVETRRTTQIRIA